MSIRFVVYYLSMFFWILAAVRQYKTELFWYFFIYAVYDPIFSIIWDVFKVKYPHVAIILNFLLLLSVIWTFRSKKSIRILIVVTLSLSLFSLFRDSFFMAYLIISIHLIIIYFFIKRTFMFVATSGKVNIFHLILLLEEISIILKMLAYLVSVQSGLIYFVATNAFEILIAIFFTLYREDNTKLHIDLRSA